MVLTKFQNLSQMVLKKIFLVISMYFYGSNPGPHGPFWVQILNKLGKGQLANATHQI